MGMDQNKQNLVNGQVPLYLEFPLELHCADVSARKVHGYGGHRHRYARRPTRRAGSLLAAREPQRGRLRADTLRTYMFFVSPSPARRLIALLPVPLLRRHGRPRAVCRGAQRQGHVVHQDPRRVGRALGRGRGGDQPGVIGHWGLAQQHQRAAGRRPGARARRVQAGFAVCVPLARAMVWSRVHRLACAVEDPRW